MTDYVQIPNLPVGDTLGGSELMEMVQSGVSRRTSVAAIATYVATTYPAPGVTSIATASPVTGGTITTTGTISLATAGVTNLYLASMSGGTIKANVTGNPASPSDVTPSQVLDVIGSTRGDILYRGATGWAVLAPGTSGYVLQTAGGGADPSWGQVSLSGGATGVLPVANGGTSFSTYTTGDLIFANSSSSLSRLNDVATGNALISGGVGAAPAYGKIGLTTHVSGTLPVASGGTGATTLTGYVKGSGTSAMTASATIPNADLQNSSVTIGSTSISLGSTSATLAGLDTVTLTQDPTSALQASTKQYVDAQVAIYSNTTFHTEVVATTTAALTATYSNGTSGVGATLTNAGAMAAFSIDSYSPSAGNRVLIKDQASGLQNGIYTVTTVGSGAVNWVLTRATDFDTTGTGPNYIELGAAVFVSGGVTYGSTSWVMNTTGTITVGTTALTWAQMSSSGNILVNAPLTKTGNTISLGTVGATFGGTGYASYAVGDVLYADSTTSLAKLPDVATGNVLLSGGVTTAPSYGKVGLTTHVSGTLGVGNGGTGTATAFTAGSAIYAGASGVYTQDNSNYFWDATNHYLGLGTASPDARITVMSPTQTTIPGGTLPSGTDVHVIGADAATTRTTQDAFGTGSYPAYTGRAARGTAASPTATQSGDLLSAFTGRGYGASVFGSASTGSFLIIAAENFTNSAMGTYASVWTTPTGATSAAEVFRFGAAGQLGIGGATYGTSGYALLSGGASAAPMWGQVSLTAGVTGTLPATNGGTGQALYAVGDVLYADTTTSLARLADVATGNALISGGVGVAPSWGKIALASAVSGTLPAANGGTSYASYAVGDILYADTTTTLAKLADVATGNVLISGGVSTAPSWGKVALATAVSGTLGTSNGGTGLTGFTAANNAIYSTSSSVLAAGTLPTAAGGTGLTGFTAANNAIYSTSSSVLAAGTLPTAAGGTALTTFTAANNALYSTSASALTAGTLPVAAGGTGVATLTTAYAPLFAGTTATGAVQTGAVGTSGQVLTSNGAGSIATFQSISINFPLLATLTANNSATLDDTTHITSTYRAYFITFASVLPASGSQTMYMRVTTDGGSTWISSGYSNAARNTTAYFELNNPTVDATTLTAAQIIYTINANDGLSGQVWLYNPSATYCSVVADMAYMDGTGAAGRSFGGGRVTQSNINGVRFLVSSGNITSGTIKIYGIL